MMSVAAEVFKTHTHTHTHTHTDLLTEDEVTAFFSESLLMKDFSHAHILCLLGVCFDTPDFSPYIIMPFMANGNMKDYLKGKRVHVTDIDTYPEVCVEHVHVQCTASHCQPHLLAKPTYKCCCHSKIKLSRIIINSI